MTQPKAQPITDLTPEEIKQIDLRIAGKIIKDKAFALSHKVNDQLMQPISTWLDDDSWMTRFKVYDGDLPNWAEYKRKQREWNEQQKQELRERMKMYWQEIHRKRNQHSAVAKMLSESRLSDSENIGELSIDNQENPESKINNISVASILSHFSPQAEHQRETQQEFHQALKISIANLLPWRTILMTDINETISNKPNQTMTLSDFKTYCEDEKTDTTSKLIHLLQLETDGQIQLSQSEPFGEINITQNISHTNIHQHDSFKNSNPLISEGSDILIKDKQGNTYPQIGWRELSNAQRDKVVADLKQNKILCKVI